MPRKISYEVDDYDDDDYDDYYEDYEEDSSYQAGESG